MLRGQYLSKSRIILKFEQDKVDLFAGELKVQGDLEGGCFGGGGVREMV